MRIEIASKIKLKCRKKCSTIPVDLRYIGKKSFLIDLNVTLVDRCILTSNENPYIRVWLCARFFVYFFFSQLLTNVTIEVVGLLISEKQTGGDCFR